MNTVQIRLSKGDESSYMGGDVIVHAYSLGLNPNHAQASLKHVPCQGSALPPPMTCQWPLLAHLNTFSRACHDVAAVSIQSSRIELSQQAVNTRITVLAYCKRAPYRASMVLSACDDYHPRAGCSLV